MKKLWKMNKLQINVTIGAILYIVFFMTSIILAVENKGRDPWDIIAIILFAIPVLVIVLCILALIGMGIYYLLKYLSDNKRKFIVLSSEYSNYNSRLKLFYNNQNVKNKADNCSCKYCTLAIEEIKNYSLFAELLSEININIENPNSINFTQSKNIGKINFILTYKYDGKIFKKFKKRDKKALLKNFSHYQRPNEIIIILIDVDSKTIDGVPACKQRPQPNKKFYPFIAISIIILGLLIIPAFQDGLVAGLIMLCTFIFVILEVPLIIYFLNRFMGFDHTQFHNAYSSLDYFLNLVDKTYDFIENENAKVDDFDDYMYDNVSECDEYFDNEELNNCEDEIDKIKLLKEYAKKSVSESGWIVKAIKEVLMELEVTNIDEVVYKMLNDKNYSKEYVKHHMNIK